MEVRDEEAEPPHEWLSAEDGGHLAEQRARALKAAFSVVADRGYASATVADIVRAAGISRSTFYELFPSKEACFLGAYEHAATVLRSVARQGAREGAASGNGEWHAALRGGIVAYLKALVAEPRFARVYLFEIMAAGPDAGLRRDESLRLFAAEYGRSFEGRPPGIKWGRRPSPQELFTVAAGIDQLICTYVRSDGVDSLIGHSSTIVETAAALLSGAAEAKLINKGGPGN